jgi:hypothetical protein
VLTVMIVALGAWLAYDQATGTDVPAEIDQLIDDYLQAWVDKDESAIRAATTDDFELTEYLYSIGADFQNPERVKLMETVRDDVEGVIRVGFGYDWLNERAGQPIITGDGPWFVSFVENWHDDDGHSLGMANYVIVDDNGALRIANHYWAGLRTWDWVN